MMYSEQLFLPNPGFETEKYNRLYYSAEGLEYSEFTVILASITALLESGYDLKFSYTLNDEVYDLKIFGADDENGFKSMEYVMSFALLNLMRRKHTNDNLIVNSLNELKHHAHEYLNQVLGSTEFAEEFEQCFCQFSLGSARKRFIRQFFIRTAEYDEEFIRLHLNQYDISLLIYHLESDKYPLEYHERAEFNHMSVAEIFAKYPILDYRNLNNPEFAETQEGKELKAAYTYFIGDKLSNLYQDTVELRWDNDKNLISRPILPLTKIGIVEEVFIYLLNRQGPRAKYSFAPESAIPVLVSSDSAYCHQMAVESLLARVEPGRRSVLDGNTEFEYKIGEVSTILRLYLQNHLGETLEKLLTEDVLTLLDSYQPGGEAFNNLVRDLPGGSELKNFKSICIGLLSLGVVSKSEEMETKSMDYLKSYMRLLENPLSAPNYEKVLALIPSKYQLFANLWGALNRISAESNLDILFEAFELVAPGLIDKKLLDSHIRQALIAQLYDIQYGEKAAKSQTRRISRTLLDGTMSDIVKNALQKLIFEGEYTHLGDEYFSLLVDELDLASTDGINFPQSYTWLVGLAKNATLSLNQRWILTTKICKKYEYLYGDTVQAVATVALDIYQFTLGKDFLTQPVIPSTEEINTIRKVNDLILSHKIGFFSKANTEAIEELMRYLEAFKDALSIPLLSESTDTSDEEDKHDYALQYLLESFTEIHNTYSTYLKLEAVKSSTAHYMHWAVENVSSLHENIKTYTRFANQPIANKLDKVLALWLSKITRIDGYLEDFDLVKDGQFNILISSIYSSLTGEGDRNDAEEYTRESWSLLRKLIRLLPKPSFEALLGSSLDTPVKAFVEENYAEAL